MRAFNHDFRVCGIVEHGKGSRKYIPIDTMDQLDGNPGKAAEFFLRTENQPQFQEAVRKEILSTPGLKTGASRP